MANIDLEALVNQVIEKLTGNKNAIASFKKDPIAAVKKILANVDLDNDLLEKIVAAVKGKIDLDELAGKAGGIMKTLKGLFGK